jgi:hypothetical protein
MFQKSLLKSFVKSFNTPKYNDVMKLVTQKSFIAEDVNSIEFIYLLAEMLGWTKCVREVKNDTEKLETLIENCQSKIETLVYKLYGLSADEIKIVEGDL